MSTALGQLDGTKKGVSKGTDHQPFVEEEVQVLRAECEALGWDKITTIKIMGR